MITYKRLSAFDFLKQKEFIKLKNQIKLERGIYCQQCNKLYVEALDHVVPVALGGAEFERNNLQLLCRYCHNLKTKEDVKKISILKKMGFIEVIVSQSWWFRDMEEVLNLNRGIKNSKKSKIEWIEEHKELIEWFLKYNQHKFDNLEEYTYYGSQTTQE